MATDTEILLIHSSSKNVLRVSKKSWLVPPSLAVESTESDYLRLFEMDTGQQDRGIPPPEYVLGSFPKERSKEPMDHYNCLAALLQRIRVDLAIHLREANLQNN